MAVICQDVQRPKSEEYSKMGWFSVVGELPPVANSMVAAEETVEVKGLSVAKGIHHFEKETLEGIGSEWNDH